MMMTMNDNDVDGARIGRLHRTDVSLHGANLSSCPPLSWSALVSPGCRSLIFISTGIKSRKGIPPGSSVPTSPAFGRDGPVLS